MKKNLAAQGSLLRLNPILDWICLPFLLLLAIIGYEKRDPYGDEGWAMNEPRKYQIAEVGRELICIISTIIVMAIVIIPILVFWLIVVLLDRYAGNVPETKAYPR